MKISIVTVCYNAEKTIERTIKSVLSQTYSNIEYIIVDGGSTDNTVDIIKKYEEKISKIISEPDEGLYDAMNKGIMNATGEYIMFLNADDKFYNDEIIQEVVCFSEHNKTDVVYGDLAFLNGENITIQTHKTLNKIYLIKNTPQQPATFYKRGVFEKVGLFDIHYKIVSDHEWFLRAFIKHKISSTYIPKTITLFSTEGISNSPKYEIKITKERNEMFTKYFGRTNFLILSFVAKYLRSLTKIPILNLFFRI